jgi:lactobin A/cerein 7B family class IIb bacteriocin
MLMTSTCATLSPMYSTAIQAHQSAEFQGIQELTEEEIDQVNGGILPAVIVAGGAVAGAYSAWHSGGNAGQIAAGAILGGVAGMYGALGMVGSATAVTMIGSFAGGGGVWTTVFPKAKQ